MTTANVKACWAAGAASGVVGGDGSISTGNTLRKTEQPRRHAAALGASVALLWLLSSRRGTFSRRLCLPRRPSKGAIGNIVIVSAELATRPSSGITFREFIVLAPKCDGVRKLYRLCQSQKDNCQ